MINKVIQKIAKNIVNKYADLMLPKKERENELEFIIYLAFDKFHVISKTDDPSKWVKANYIYTMPGQQKPQGIKLKWREGVRR